MSPTIVVAAGDASGDLHCAGFVRAFREQVPEARFVGLGGVAMEKAGVELVVHQRDLAVGGLVEVLGSVRRVLAAWRRMRELIAETRPDLVVLVDSPDLVLPIARHARRAGRRTLYYICPQVWAWRRGRLRKIARRFDRLAVIFPFERDVFAETGLPVDFVGHPLVEPLAAFAREHTRASARAALGLDPDRDTVLLMPGSRHNELASGLPLMLDTARALYARAPGTGFVLALAPTLERADAEALIAAAALPEGLCLDVVEGRTYEAVVACDVALAKPGTSTVEVALLGRPLVAAGRAHPFTAAVMRRIVQVPSFTMPNLIAGAPVVPEFLQEEARPERIALALQELLAGPAREAQLARLATVRTRLGSGGAARNTVRIAREMIAGGPVDASAG